MGSFEKVTDGIQERLHSASERVIDFKDDAARDLGKRVDSLGKMMKRHPMLSIGIGLGTGYLLALIIHRR